ncbi:hypothetical protein A4A49_35799 [Nicotiana attenuata]|uniref:Uncharacterized protein n=1 Tax=Nicotiana attenuata TaxID=49451 RepID=A0A1J6KW28_NICAT|nr:hypothetical protein A4A49_35799 [Nicotiana attenuata]
MKILVAKPLLSAFTIERNYWRRGSDYGSSDEKAHGRFEASCLASKVIMRASRSKEQEDLVLAQELRMQLDILQETI